MTCAVPQQVGSVYLKHNRNDITGILLKVVLNIHKSYLLLFASIISALAKLYAKSDIYVFLHTFCQ